MLLFIKDLFSNKEDKKGVKKMKVNYLNKKVEKVIEEVKKLRVVTYNELLQVENEDALYDDGEWVTPFVFIYNAGEDLFIIQDFYKDSLIKCNKPYLIKYLKVILK